MRINSRERVGLTDTEKAKQDRRLARAIKQGMCRAEIQRSYGVSEARVMNLAKELGLEVVRRGNGRTKAT